MLRCLIVDDDEISRTLLTQLIKKTDFLTLAQTCVSAVEAANVMQKESFDVMFLDVEMPEMTGLQFLQTLKNPPEIVLVTSKPEYAVDAFEFAVADYLVKPVAYPRFLKAVTRIQERLTADEEIKSSADSLFAKVNSQLINISMKDIQWIEAYGDYVTLNTERDKFVVHSTMKGIERKLPSQDFIRVHRSYIVRIDKIKSIEETLIIIGKKLIPIGDSYRSTLMKRLTLL